MFINRLANFKGKRPRVTYTSYAPISNDIKPQLIHISAELRLVIVIGDNFGAGGEGGLYPRLTPQPLLNRLLG